MKEWSWFGREAWCREPECHTTRIACGRIGVTMPDRTIHCLPEVQYAWRKATTGNREDIQLQDTLLQHHQRACCPDSRGRGSYPSC